MIQDHVLGVCKYVIYCPSFTNELTTLIAVQLVNVMVPIEKVLQTGRTGNAYADELKHLKSSLKHCSWLLTGYQAPDNRMRD